MRMSTSKKIEVDTSGAADSVVREIAKAENMFQEELNRGFGQLAEGSFKGLRRQLPVTRQKVEWEKIGGYRVSARNFMESLCANGFQLGQDIGGGRSK